MTESRIRRLIEQVRHGRLSRRDFIGRLVAVGLSAPMASMLLVHAGVAQTAGTPPPYKPIKRGGGGALKMLMWQGPTLLNPHFATGTKDQIGCRIFHEGLVAWDAEGQLQPVLAAEIPSRDNGGVAADGRSVLWTLKRGVTWHDGAPFNADDVVFNAQYAIDPATASVSLGSFMGLKIEKIDAHTVRVVFDKPAPYWPQNYATTMLIPRHLHAPYIGAKSREAPANLKPVGTGPYKFVDFKPGDMLRGKINTAYHLPARPHFDTVEVKGGGDAVSAARAVLQTGEYDYAWNLLVEDEVLRKLEAGGKGRLLITPGGATEFIQLAFADPWTEVDGERASPKSRHPVFSDPAVRQAFALLIDRSAILDYVYGRTGLATTNILNAPASMRSPNTRAEFSVDKANAVLDAAGWKRAGGANGVGVGVGVREKNGRKLKFVYQTSVNALRQKVQAVLKQSCQKAGIELELKAVTAAVFFSSDMANPDTSAKFQADLQMYNYTSAPDPEVYMEQYVSWEIASKANKWQGRNISRWRNDEVDRLARSAESELDPVKRAAMFIRMNDLVVGGQHILPLVGRPGVDGVANKLVAPPSWGGGVELIHHWYRDA